MDDLIVRGVVEPELAAKLFERLRLQLPALSSGKCSKKPLGVLWRSQKMSGFDESAQLSDGNQCHVSAFAPMNDDRFPRIDRLIEQRLQVRSRLRVGRFRCHSDMYRQAVQNILGPLGMLAF